MIVFSTFSLSSQKRKLERDSTTGIFGICLSVCSFRGHENVFTLLRTFLQDRLGELQLLVEQLVALPVFLLALSPAVLGLLAVRARFQLRFFLGNLY